MPTTPPDPVLRLLWRRHLDPSPTGRRGPRKKIDVDSVVSAAVAMADAEGLAAVTMRSLATRLGVGAMSLYTYVPQRSDLIALMVDEVLVARELPRHGEGLRERLAAIAQVQYQDCREHAWLLDVSGIRAWLGPGASGRYEWQLEALEGEGFTDVEMDQAVALLIGFASSIARAEHEKAKAERESGTTEYDWWMANAEELGIVMGTLEFPLAGRVGQATGEAYQAATNPAAELEFGLARIIDGLMAHLGR